MIKVTNLSKHYGNKKAVDNISFSIGEGEIVGLLGPNGAGKSTTMNMITGYISSTSGEVEIDGMNILEYPVETKKKIGYLPEIPPLYPDMTVTEYLEFVFELKNASGKKKEVLKEICETAKITNISGRLIKNLSKGYKQRVGLAQALIGDPEILIFDEPTIGLDPKQVVEFRNVVKKLGKDHTVIFSSHILSEINAVCEKIIIMNQGKIVAEGKTEDITEITAKGNRYIARIKGEKTRVVALLRGIPGLMRANSKSTDNSEIFDYAIEAARDIREDLFYLMAKENCPILVLRPRETSLEETFIRITNSHGSIEA